MISFDHIFEISSLRSKNSRFFRRCSVFRVLSTNDDSFSTYREDLTTQSMKLEGLSTGMEHFLMKLEDMSLKLEHLSMKLEYLSTKLEDLSTEFPIVQLKIWPLVSQ